LTLGNELVNWRRLLGKQRSEAARELIRAEIRKRKALYGEFIEECSKLLIDSLTHALKKPKTMLSPYALLNRIRLSASEAVRVEAELVMRQITEQYFARNLSLEEVRDLALSGSADPLKSFSEACRAELRSIHAGV